MIQLGDKRMEVPCFGSASGISDVGPQPCRVVYIHPLRRFYTVEFRSAVTGEAFRQSFYFHERAGQRNAPEKQDSPERAERGWTA